MSYKLNVRIITTSGGYKNLENFFENKKKVYEISNDIVYLGYENLTIREVDEIETVIREFSKNNITYRKVIIGEEMNDITEEEFTSEFDKNRKIPYIFIKRQFDDIFVMDELKNIKN